MAFAKAILCVTALVSFLPWAVSEPTVKLAIPGNRKYLVVGEFAKNFLYCNTTGISQVVLCLVSIEQESFQVDYIQDPRYNFDCSKTTDISCVLSIRSVKEVDSGTYTCADFDCGAAVQTSLYVPIYNTPLIDQLTGSTSDGTVKEGQSFYLNCLVVVPAGGLPEASIEWRLDGKVVKSQNGFSDFTYSVAHANRKDSGTYSCVVLSKGSEIDLKTYPAKINVTYAAQVASFEVVSLNHLINASGAVYAEAGTSVTFECTADGNPAPFVAIRYNQDEELVGPKLLDSVSRSLTLMKGNNYTGIYSCEAYNSENTIHAKKSIRFIVYENVKINDFAFNDTANDTLAGCSRHVIAGNRETLQCTADGVPTPSVAILNESGAEVATGLRLASYRFPAEKNETYKCQAKTAVINSTADAKFVLCVTPRPYAAQIISFVVRSSNRLINVSGTIYAEAGTNVTFDCTADGYPVPSVAIQFRGDEDELVTQSSKFLRSVSRAVSPAEGKRDTGFYICTASNSKNVSSERICLFVYENPKIVFFALNQTNDTVTGQCSAHVIAGDKRTLQCTADGEPHPSVVILNEKGERVANGSRNAFYRFTARKNETYECGAKTAAINSTANAKFVLCVTPRPYAPRITSFVVRSSNRLINESGTVYAETGTNVTIEFAMRNWWVPNSLEVFLETLRGLTEKEILASTFVKLLTVKMSVRRPSISSFTRTLK
ncbi:cell adhesion molecule DSCAML1-like isoform X2 [Oscarella lobularis]|uniref:cell adhesion molecule DSCAML1-like isoform X2 n=1 Tax=Oscarella lobularis TaxID=121494 RepID=UPI003314457E